MELESGHRSHHKACVMLPVSYTQLLDCMYCMQTLDILRFRERLEMESERTQRMSSAELVALCKER